MNKLFSVITLALITGSAFAAAPEATTMKTEIDKADGKVTGVKNDTEAVKKNAQDFKTNAENVQKQLRDIKK